MAKTADGKDAHATRWRPAGHFRARTCVLAHVIQGVEGIYDRYGYLSEKRNALEKLDALIDRIRKTIEW